MPPMGNMQGTLQRAQGQARPQRPQMGMNSIAPAGGGGPMGPPPGQLGIPRPMPPMAGQVGAGMPARPMPPGGGFMGGMRRPMPMPAPQGPMGPPPMGPQGPPPGVNPQLIAALQQQRAMQSAGPPPGAMPPQAMPPQGPPPQGMPPQMGADPRAQFMQQMAQRRMGGMGRPGF